MDPLSRAGRWARRITALVVAWLGAVDLVLAATAAPPRRPGFLGVDYVAAAVIGARYGLVAVGVTALIVTRALLHGKRLAWWLALIAAVGSLPSHHVRGSGLIALASAASAIGVLVTARRAFVARSDPALARRGLRVLVAGEAIVFGYAATGLYLLDEHFPAPNTLRSTPGDAARMLFLLPVRLEPVTRHGRWFVESVRVAALGVAMIGLGWLVATVIGTPGQWRDRAITRGLLLQYGDTGLAHFHLLDDKSWLIASDTQAFVGYKVIRGVAVALGEPIGAPQSMLVAVREFLTLCALNGWVPVFHQLTERGRDVVAAAGLKTLKIGEEAIVDLASFSLEGREHRTVRQAVRRVERAGYRAIDLPVTEETLPRLREVSDAWLASGNHRERTFTLGRFDPEYLRSTPVVAVLDQDGRIQAFANVLPSYRSIDASFDLMRRRPDAVNGTMDFLFVQLIERFAAAGYRGMNLGLAPLAGSDDDTLAGRALRLLYERGGKVFNFAGLRSFKDKWRPRWEPRYLGYRADGDLPRVMAAVARAGELPDPRNPAVRLLGVVKRFPFTTAFAALQLWLVPATAADPNLHTQLVRTFGMAWPDLMHGHFWRLVTATLIQARSGFSLSNIMLLAIVLPLAEWRLGRRVWLIYLLGDWVSTLPVLLGLRYATALGFTEVGDLAYHRDIGTSSATWALAAATAWSVPAGWPRRIAVTGVLGILVEMMVTNVQLFTVQHLVSALAVILSGWGVERFTHRRNRRESCSGAPVTPGAIPQSGSDQDAAVSAAP